MPNRSIRDERNKVGPADPATRKRMLNERLSEREPAGNYAPTSAAPVKPAPTDLSVAGAVRNLKSRKAKIDKESDF
jgi:hypothetical protein